MSGRKFGGLRATESEPLPYLSLDDDQARGQSQLSRRQAHVEPPPHVACSRSRTGATWATPPQTGGGGNRVASRRVECRSASMPDSTARNPVNLLGGASNKRVLLRSGCLQRRLVRIVRPRALRKTSLPAGVRRGKLSQLAALARLVALLPPQPPSIQKVRIADCELWQGSGDDQFDSSEAPFIHAPISPSLCDGLGCVAAERNGSHHRQGSVNWSRGSRVLCILRCL